MFAPNSPSNPPRRHSVYTATMFRANDTKRKGGFFGLDNLLWFRIAGDGGISCAGTRDHHQVKDSMTRASSSAFGFAKVTVP
jgi:hypothetical protein